MLPVVCVVGRSGVGKTVVVERLVAELKRRGYRAATVKHDIYDFEIDQPGKDSWRHAQAGADCVVISSPQKLALIKRVDHDATLAELALAIGPDYDVVVAEGFKASRGAKVEVHRKGMGELLCSPQELIAVVSDEALDTDLPQYSLDDAASLAELLRERVLQKERDKATLFVNLEPVPLKLFVQELLVGGLLGMVSALKRVGDVTRLDLFVRR